jgi:RNA polymerase sigma factor (TIGR02999 family)
VNEVGQENVSEEQGPAAATEVTDLLRARRSGEVSDAERLFPLLYKDLRRAARRQLARERGGHTLQTTALVHEAYLRLVDQRRADWREREHFLAVAAIAMRRVLIDYARARAAGKRAHERLTLSAGAEKPAEADSAFDLLDLDLALDRLARDYPRPARVVELRFFAGLETGEIARVLAVGERTVKRDWAFARAWLLRELAAEGRGRAAGGEPP